MWTRRETAALWRFIVSMPACVVISFAGLTLIGCTPNQPYRTAEPADCAVDDCDPETLIEKHRGHDLAFVEFTDRGNVFDRKRMQQVLDYVAEQARYDPSNPDRGVITVVFVHGWKHNAAPYDSNVRSFREFLRKVSVLSKGDPLKVIGVYVGWRGLSYDMVPLTNSSYWDRKTAAQQVATGGFPELILRLEREIIDDERPNRNMFLVTGHSFGGAIVLSALKSFFLERVIEATASNSDDDCVKTRPFGHGAVLLNPAIEANEALQLKELVAETCFADTQDRLMHVISSDAGSATNNVFRLGQFYGGNIVGRQAELTREFDGENVQLHESDLNMTTVGNFIPFQTGQLEFDESGERWHYRSCVGKEKACIDPADRARHIIPGRHNGPLAFIRADLDFIANHHDVFNDNVSAYLAAVMAEARYKRLLNNGVDEHLIEECHSDDFEPCFAAYQGLFEDVKLEGAGDDAQQRP